jgi:hypothetical protein
MKKILTYLFFMGAALCTQAQTEHKNELSLGYFSAGEFFDTSAFKVSEFGSGRNVSLKYTRVTKGNTSFSLTYARCSFLYGLQLMPSGAPVYPYTITSRYQKTVSADIGKQISRWSLNMRAKVGIRYNWVSVKREHHAGGWHSNGWYESFGAENRYGRLGASMGLSIAHPIFWRIFGELDSEFAKMFTRVDRNQLLLSYRIGIRF